MRFVLVGATSAIAQHAAREWLRGEKEPAAFYLLGRNQERLDAVAADLRARGAARAETWAGDLADPAAADGFMARAEAALGGAPDLVLIAHGSLTDEARAAVDPDYLAAEWNVNLLSPARFAAEAARVFRARRDGTLAVITSVAGERGRASNFHYGAAKAGLIAYCSGLRASLARDGVRLVELRPGFIATPMTRHLPAGPLVCPVEKAGRLCARAIRRGTPMAYIPGWWAHIMRPIRWLPEKVFGRMKF